MAHQLLKIVNDLVHNRGLRAQFNRDPEAFMNQYQLSETGKTALYTMDPCMIGKALGVELNGFNFETGEFPACQFGEPLREVDLLYPKPTPKTFAIVPERAAAQDGLEVSVWGQSFPNDAEVVFDPPLQHRSQRRQGTYRCCEMVVPLRSPTAGVYTVTVTSPRLGKVIKSDQAIQLTLT